MVALQKFANQSKTEFQTLLFLYVLNRKLGILHNILHACTREIHQKKHSKAIKDFNRFGMFLDIIYPRKHALLSIKIYTISGLGMGITNLPPAARYSSCCFRISLAKFQASNKTTSG
jgi:hypothetical protein